MILKSQVQVDLNHFETFVDNYHLDRLLKIFVRTFEYKKYLR